MCRRRLFVFNLNVRLCKLLRGFGFRAGYVYAWGSKALSGQDPNLFVYFYWNLVRKHRNASYDSNLNLWLADAEIKNGIIKWKNTNNSLIEFHKQFAIREHFHIKYCSAYFLMSSHFKITNRALNCFPFFYFNNIFVIVCRPSIMNSLLIFA